ncbi:MAG: HlyC/CorC family transporter [Planctomycetes bacterium]|nr:HlyC/CorC family transporter [Planctomycetota bacterium]
MASALAVLGVLLLLVLNGLFVAAEFGVIGANRSRLEALAAHGSRGAAAVLRVLRAPQHQDRFIATTQVGITLASLGLGMYGEHALADRLAPLLAGLGAFSAAAAHAIASTAALAAMTFLHVVLGEMVPKSIALARSERTALTTVPLLRAVELVLLPLVVTLEFLGHRALRLFGIPPTQTSVSRYYTPEDLVEAVRESQASGLLRQEAGEVVRDLFAFGERSAGEAMVPRVLIQGVPLGCPAEQIGAIVRRAAHARYPVFVGNLDDVVGTVHVRRLFRCVRDGTPVGRELVRPAPFVPKTMRLDRVLAIMRRERVHMVVVMDESGGTAGLLSVEDLFEEVIGDIEESAADHSKVVVQRAAAPGQEGEARAAGTVRLDELAEALGVPIRHDEIDTVSGLILALLERPAQVGDRVQHAGLHFEVTAVAGRGVKECRVRFAAGR